MVTCSAAITRSPSSSRSAASRTRTGLPAAISATACSIGSTRTLIVVPPPAACRPAKAAIRSTYLASTSTSRFTGVPTGARPSVVRASVVGISPTSNHATGLVRRAHRGDRQRDAVDRHRALLDQVARQARRHLDPHPLPPVTRLAQRHGADAVDVALHDVAAEPAVRRHRPLQVDPVAGHETAERAARQRLGHHVDREPSARRGLVGDGEADPVDRDRRAVHGVGGDQRPLHDEPRRPALALEPHHGAELLHDPGEHQPTSCWSSSIRSPAGRRGTAVIFRSAPVRTTSTTSSRAASSMVAMPRSPTAAGPAPSSTGAR